MLKFESDFHGDKVLLEFEDEEEDIYTIIDRFKYFLLAKSYCPDMVERIMYLDDADYAKFKLIED